MGSDRGVWAAHLGTGAGPSTRDTGTGAGVCPVRVFMGDTQLHGTGGKGCKGFAPSILGTKKDLCDPGWDGGRVSGRAGQQTAVLQVGNRRHTVANS